MSARIAFWIGIVVIFAHVALQATVWGGPIVLQAIISSNKHLSWGAFQQAFELLSSDVARVKGVSTGLASWIYVVVAISCIAWLAVAVMLIRRTKRAVQGLYFLIFVLVANTLIVSVFNDLSRFNFSELILFYLIEAAIFSMPTVRKVAAPTATA